MCFKQLSGEGAQRRGLLHAQQVASKEEEGTQAQPGPSSQLKEKKAAAGKAAMLAAVPGEIPIMLPEKLPANKVHHLHLSSSQSGHVLLLCSCAIIWPLGRLQML